MRVMSVPDDAAEYEKLLPDSRQRHLEWFWMFAGAAVGSGAAGLAIMWANVAPWATVATGVVMFICCVAVRQYFAI